ncbi:hypothetical protein SynA1528_00180 [Synechococcus sp. A15-28]|nr:hypothetical protein SynA1528_00180 [Synechococcus sp. A15-28]
MCGPLVVQNTETETDNGMLFLVSEQTFSNNLVKKAAYQPVKILKGISLDQS